MTQKIQERDPQDAILSAFDLFANAVGGGTAQESKIRIEDLRRIVRELRETLEEPELRTMTDEPDMSASPRSGTNKPPSTQTPWKPMTSRHTLVHVWR
ncbi:hypothetical protein L873DRAFT_767507 [Choiromyces venosus 120613-1]|uniref:Uncharacterized protein n=1 Tax=Choiromyces venosus 120613-1 TaxID=1336337 RepID=A0A3N4IT51_9PEZI|nr:hypothetical protein L873DRAFT_767507 [Choiromyces venosus 120613-1]